MLGMPTPNLFGLRAILAPRFLLSTRESLLPGRCSRDVLAHLLTESWGSAFDLPTQFGRARLPCGLHYGTWGWLAELGRPRTLQMVSASHLRVLPGTRRLHILKTLDMKYCRFPKMEPTSTNMAE